MINQSQSELNSYDNCGQKAVLASPTIDITVQGGPHKFSKDVQIQLLAQIPSSYSKDSRHCVAYTEQRTSTSEWQCLSDRPQSHWTNSGVGVVSEQTNHFTSFAVLFGEPALITNQCGWNWIWIACIVATGVMCTLWVVVVLLTTHSKRFRFYTMGYDEATLRANIVNLTKH
jgi:hypothetical protein